MKVGAGEGQVVGPRKLARRLGGAEEPRFSLCVMLTRWDEYRACLDSYQARGFDESVTEYIVLDNSAGNQADAYVGLNEFLQSSRGEYIILSHQDVLLLEDGREKLDACLAALDERDPDWAVCGNGGYTDDGWPAFCVSDPHNDELIMGGPFPVRVVSLDENFMVVRRVANLALSADLKGFHHYGSDLCTMADILGWHAYVIDFFLRHNSGGTADQRYYDSHDRIIAKYRRALRPRWVHLVTKKPLFIAGTRWQAMVAAWARRLGQRIGTVPRNRDLGNPVLRAKRDARRSRRDR